MATAPVTDRRPSQSPAGTPRVETRVDLEHPGRASEFIDNRDRASWHDQALWFVRSKRDKSASTIPEWETLRERASQIKQHVLTRLPNLLEEFERNATANGIVVHWAKDADEHNAIVLKILREAGVERIVKSKSMLTEECHLNPYLEKHGVAVVDTDLGEWIVQLREEPPSHIVMPAIHIKREEVGDLFHRKLGTEAGATEPKYLAGEARRELRRKFMAATAGVTGVNFAIAETGGFVVCTNEGNADLGVGLPKLHIACMGLEKIIPREKDLGVFTRLLGRSATGQPITSYTSHFHGPRDADSAMHVVIVDNGRSQMLGKPEFRAALQCIRCGACMNTCPVYRRSGGHSYANTVPGPIGSVLAPNKDPRGFRALPYACSLCGSCGDVCPVKIPLPKQLYAWRKVVAENKYLPWTKRAAMKLAGYAMSSPRLFAFGGKVARKIVPRLPRFLVYNRLNPWGKQRELPPMAERSFAEMVKDRPKPPRSEPPA